MSEYVILTESSCDLSPELVTEADVEVLPLSFTIDGKNYPHYPDARAYPIKDFYQRMREGAVAVTAAANVVELTEGMEKHLRQGRDVLFLCFSSGLSSTRDACAVAAEDLRERYPDRKIYTVDTLAASGGQGLLVLLAGRKRKAGATIEDVRDFAEETKFHVGHWFTVDDLVYLKRGGRVSSAAAVVGTMLNLKPVLHVDNEGHLIPMEKVADPLGLSPRRGADRRPGPHHRRTHWSGPCDAVLPGGAPLKPQLYRRRFPNGNAAGFPHFSGCR